MALIQQALNLAVRAHDGQFRKGTMVPYVFHPIRVADILVKAGESNNHQCIAAALLHDVLEDTAFSLKDFPQDVVDIVELLTKRPGQSFDDYLSNIRLAVHGCREAALIKLADRIDNVRDVGTTDQWWIKKYRASSLKILQMGQSTLQNHSLVSELSEAIRKKDESVKAGPKSN